MRKALRSRQPESHRDPPARLDLASGRAFIRRLPTRPHPELDALASNVRQTLHSRRLPDDGRRISDACRVFPKLNVDGSSLVTRFHPNGGDTTAVGPSRGDAPREQSTPERCGPSQVECQEIDPKTRRQDGARPTLGNSHVVHTIKVELIAGFTQSGADGFCK
jgi:hypothetical protein